MTCAGARALAVTGIPVIDIPALRAGEPAAVRTVAVQMLAAAAQLGFFHVRGHGVADALPAEAQTQARAFFRLPEEQKLQVAINHRQRGFLRLGDYVLGRYPGAFACRRA